MISKDKQYRTRDGREVRIYATDHGEMESVIVGAVKYKNMWATYYWDRDGKSSNQNRDLIEIRPRIKLERWVNVYPDSNDGFSRPYPTKEYADELAEESRIACVKIVIDCEEGEGL